MATKTTSPKVSSAESVKELHYLASALKAPRITEAAERLADQARDAGWSFEDYLAAVLEREVSARNESGARSAPLGSPHPRRWRTSTSTPNPRFATRSPRSPPGRS